MRSSAHTRSPLTWRAPRAESGLAIAAVFLCVLFGQASVANAQLQWTPTSRDDATMELGWLSVAPKIFVLSGIDTNDENDTDAEEATWETTLAPQGEAWFSLGPATVSTAGLVEFRLNANRSQPRPNHFEEMNFYFEEGVIRPFFHYTHRDHYARPTGFESGERSQRLEDRFLGGVIMDVTGRMNLSAFGGRHVTDYDSAAVYKDSGLREQLARTTDEAGVQFDHELTAFTTVGFFAGYTMDKFRFEPERDTDTFNLGASVTFAEPAIVSGAVFAAYRNYRPKEDNIEPFRGLVFGGGTGFSLPGQIEFAIAGNRSTEFSYTINLGYYIATGFSVSASRPITGSIHASFRYSHYWLEYGDIESEVVVEPQNFNGTRVDAGATIFWAARPDMRFGIDLGVTEDRNTVNPFRGVRTIAFYSYGLGRFRYLDRAVPVS